MPTSIGESLLLDLPSRGMGTLINLVPGVAGDMAFGGTKASNGFYIDGIDATAQAEQDLVLQFPENWIHEVKVVGLGAEAEYGKFTGVAAHSVVRSGANTLSGLAEYRTTNSDWVANNTRELSESLQQSFGSERIGDGSWNLNGQVGAPLRHDRVWLFAGLDHATDRRAPAGYDGPGWREADETRALGKVTAAVWPGGRVEGLLEGGRMHVANAGIGHFVEPEAAGQSRQRMLSWNARGLSSLGRSWGQLHKMFAEHDRDAILIVELNPGGIYLWNGWGFPERINDNFYAIGSGGMAALEAMRHGLTPEEAVKRAIAHDENTGSPVKVEYLLPPELLPKKKRRGK